MPAGEFMVVKTQRYRHRPLLWGGMGLLLMLGLAAVVHWWPGRGVLTYFGFDMRPARLKTPADPRYPLATPRNDIPGLANFARVSDQLYRGAQPTREGFIQLRNMGIRTVISLRETRSDRELMSGLGLKYLQIPFNPAAPQDEAVTTFLQVVANPANQPVFVHCQAGSDRTGTMVAIYRVVQQNWPMQEAAGELERFGFHEVWTDLLRYLDSFDKAAYSLDAPSRPPSPSSTSPDSASPR